MPSPLTRIASAATATALSGDTMDRLHPHCLLVDQLVSPIARGRGVVVRKRARAHLNDRRHVVPVVRVEPERRSSSLGMAGRTRSPEKLR